MSKEDLYILGKKLGLNKNDIQFLLNYKSDSNKQAYLSNGPGGGGYSPNGFLYGSISPYDF